MNHHCKFLMIPHHYCTTMWTTKHVCKYFRQNPELLHHTKKRTWTCEAETISQEAEEEGQQTFPPTTPQWILRLHLSLWCIWKYDISSQTGFALLFYYIWPENRSFFIIFCNIYIYIYIYSGINNHCLQDDKNISNIWGGGEPYKNVAKL